MRTHRLTLCLLALALAACGRGAPTAGQPVDFSLACDKANDGQVVAVTGYLRLPDSFTGEDSVMLRLYAADDFGGPPVGVLARFGSEANQAERVPDQYSDEDLKVHAADGQLLPFGTRVRVSGKVYFPLVDQDFDCGLENILIEPAE